MGAESSQVTDTIVAKYILWILLQKVVIAHRLLKASLIKNIEISLFLLLFFSPRWRNLTLNIFLLALFELTKLLDLILIKFVLKPFEKMIVLEQIGEDKIASNSYFRTLK